MMGAVEIMAVIFVSSGFLVHLRPSLLSPSAGLDGLT